MEAKKSFDKKCVKKIFKELYTTYDTEKAKELSTEQGAKLIVEGIKKAGGEMCEEKATKILKQFDVNDDKKNSKKEIRMALMVAADIEEVTEKMIEKIKKRHAKKMNKKKKENKEQKAKRKQMKKLRKTELKAVTANMSKEERKNIDLDKIKEIVVGVLKKGEIEGKEGEVDEWIAKLDQGNRGKLRVKDAKLIIDQLTGRKEIDLDRYTKKFQKWQKKQEKKALKKKNKCKGEAPAEAPVETPVEATAEEPAKAPEEAPVEAEAKVEAEVKEEVKEEAPAKTD